MIQTKVRVAGLALLLALGVFLTTAHQAGAFPPPQTKVTIPVPTCGMMVTISSLPGSGAFVSGVYAPGFGRLGNLQFQPGDVIYSIGGISVAPGVNLDTLIANANATGNRVVVVRDVNSGQVLTLIW
jgi:hypothetical protein